MTDDSRPTPQRFYLTFGSQYAHTPHPHWPAAHPDGWVEVWASTEGMARAMVVAAFGVNWSNLYEDVAPLEPEWFPRGKLGELRCWLTESPSPEFADRIAALVEGGYPNPAPDDSTRTEREGDQ